MDAGEISESPGVGGTGPVWDDSDGDGERELSGAVVRFVGTGMTGPPHRQKAEKGGLLHHVEKRVKGLLRWVASPSPNGDSSCSEASVKSERAGGSNCGGDGELWGRIQEICREYRDIEGRTSCLDPNLTESMGELRALAGKVDKTRIDCENRGQTEFGKDLKEFHDRLLEMAVSVGFTGGVYTIFFKGTKQLSIPEQEWACGIMGRFLQGNGYEDVLKKIEGPLGRLESRSKSRFGIYSFGGCVFV